MSKYKFNRSPQIVKHIETENRVIKTKIPCEGTEEIIQGLEKYESRSMQGQIPLVWDHAKGHSIYDMSKNKWIDFTSTIFVSNVGHSNPNIVNAVKSMLNKPLLHTYAYGNELRLEYQKALIEFAGKGFEKAFLLSSGTESTEAALKLMRLNSTAIGKRRPGIICFENNWHGRTLGAQMMSSNQMQRDWIGYKDPNIHHLPFPYPWHMNKLTGREFFVKSLEKLDRKNIDISTDICGFMLETFQGWGAVFYPTDFVESIREVADEYNILVTFDEMQSGFGRTGKNFGYEHYNIQADILCCGKGIASGFPLSAVIGKKEIMDLPDVGDMSSTHSANPIVCAAGLATLKEIENLDLVNETKRKSNILFNKLNSLKEAYPDRISGVFGKGLIAALLFKKPGSDEPDHEFPSMVCEKSMQKGVLFVHTGRESIKFGPPLTITDTALLEGIEVLCQSIHELNQSIV